jgi:electron transfer flavoprotein beta subunit
MPEPLNIVVCVKQVPDTWSEKKLTPEDKTLDRETVDPVLNELDEYAIEEALRLVEAGGGKVTVLSMGPEKTSETLRKALSMGADEAVHLVDDALHGTDALGTSYALAQALGTLEFDLVILGSESTDARMSVVPAMLAERLGLPQLTFANSVEVGEGKAVTIHRQTEDGYQVVEGQAPAVVSVVEKINEPRYPSFKGIMAAKKKPMTTLSAADAGIDTAGVGLGGAYSTVEDFAARPPREAGTVVTDEGEGGTKLAEFLASRKFI